MLRIAMYTLSLSYAIQLVNCLMLFKCSINSDFCMLGLLLVFLLLVTVNNCQLLRGMCVYVCMCLICLCRDNSSIANVLSLYTDNKQIWN